MKTSAYLELLQGADDPVHWEYPGGWEHYDYEGHEHQFRSLAKSIEDIFPGCEAESFPEVQDATFHGEIRIPFDESTKVPFIWVRVSKFGNFSTIFSFTELDPQLVARIRQLIELAGFIYIPKEVLDEPYTGPNPGVTGFRTWWERYFDWA